MEASGHDPGMDMNKTVSSEVPSLVGVYTPLKFSEDDAKLLSGSDTLKRKSGGPHAFIPTQWKGVALVVFVCALLSLGSGIITAVQGRSQDLSGGGGVLLRFGWTKRGGGVRGLSPGKILVLRCLNPCFFSSFSSRR